jgi:hypothetical protein
MKSSLFALTTGLLLVFTACGAAAEDQKSTHFAAGELQMDLRASKQGIAIEHLLDAKLGVELLSLQPLPLFTLTLRQTGSSNEIRLAADGGWRRTSVKHEPTELELRWLRPADETMAGLSVTAAATAESNTSALHWKLRVENRSLTWSVWRLSFPQLELADPGSNAAVLFPRGPGEVQRGIWDGPFNYHGNYPSSSCAMQFMAAYGAGEQASGLYVAAHDPWGSTKDLTVKSDEAAHKVRLSFEHPAPNMGLWGNGFELKGEVVWQLLRGDWFDAAMIYKQWAQREARWWPRLGPDGRTDTPRWMRDLNAWAMTGGGPAECMPAVKQFQQFLGLPVGFHWYNWHQIPFDNDYPHYFPAKEGFTPGVAELQTNGVFVMPYINGRLWDSHDRGAEDFEFTKVARRAVTKKEDGSPYLEKYGSKETNGQPVWLGVMCPGTALWRNTVSNVVTRLLRECGTASVYIDQVAAAAPKLCMDRTHGHPLGGGHWWNEGYWQMLEDIRQAKPPEAMLTTECNSEPFVGSFDGFLTWHWQYNGQVPAFPAVYGGTIQMFGRAYRGGDSKDLALRMKAGQQLVFGEQLGWLDPGVVKEKDNAEFFRQMVQLRANFSRYFSAGEMVRPPKLSGQVPRVKADWQWSGVWQVTTDAVLTGAWRLPAEKRLALFFINVSDGPVAVSVQADAAGWGLPVGHLRGKIVCSDPENAATPNMTFGALVTFPARQAQAWELAW